MGNPNRLHWLWVLNGMAAAMLACALNAQAQEMSLPPLPRLGLQKNSVTVSGISSGAYMASQFGVAYSRTVTGVGLVAGGPYGCSKGSMVTASRDCSCTGLFCADYNPNIYLNYSDDTLRYTRGDIDDLANLKKQRVWIYHGTNDKVVNKNLTEAARKFYDRHRVPAAQIDYVTMPEAGHAFPSPDSTDKCNLTQFPYMVNCNYDGAGKLLQWLYPDIKNVQRGVTRPESLRQFDQSAYAEAGKFTSLDKSAWVYVPQACQQGGAQCKLHVAFHGCEQGQRFDSNGTVFGKRFVERAGYNEWAEAAQVVVLYPQVAPSNLMDRMPYRYNPKGCWDFWGYTEELAAFQRKFGTRSAPQMKAIKAMIDTLVSARAD